MKMELSKLKHHPKSIDIYGDTSKENLEDLIASISIHGIKDEIIINSKNQIISGNRRFEVAKFLKLKSVNVKKISIKPEDEIAEIINRNVSREKTYSMKLQEIKGLYKIYGVGQGKRTDLSEGEYKFADKLNLKKKPTVRHAVSAMTHIKESEIQKLLAIDKSKPELIKALDERKMTVNTAYKSLESTKYNSFIKGQYKNNQATFSTQTLVHRLYIRDKTDLQYSNIIIQYFLQKYEENKNKSKIIFDLDGVFRESISKFESEVDKEIEVMDKDILQSISDVENAIRTNSFTPKIFNYKNASGENKFSIEDISMDEFLKRLNVKMISDISKKQLNDIIFLSFAAYSLMQNKNTEGKRTNFVAEVVFPNNKKITVDKYSYPLIHAYLQSYNTIKALEGKEIPKNQRGGVVGALAELNSSFETIRWIVRNEIILPRYKVTNS